MKRVLLNAEQIADTKSLSKDEWLNIRKQGIGGSDASAICGLSKWSSPLSVYLDKVGERPSEIMDNEAMRQGRDLEQYVAERFLEYMEQQGTPKKVQRCNYVLRNIDNPFMMANVDRMVVGEQCGLECKTTSILNRSDWNAGEIPNEYYTQCLHYMAVTGASKWYLAVLVLNSGFYVYEIERDEKVQDDIEALVKLENQFWYLNVQKREPPKPNGSECDSNLLAEMYPNSDSDLVADLDIFQNEIDTYKALGSQMKELETKQTAIKQELQQVMGNAELGTAGTTKVSWKMQERKTLDKDLVKKVVGDKINEMYKVSSCRVFKILETKGG